MTGTSKAVSTLKNKTLLTKGLMECGPQGTENYEADLNDRLNFCEYAHSCCSCKKNLGLSALGPHHLSGLFDPVVVSLSP
ncbi:hypothetical protein GGD62_004183 [Bradyrhizobium sp. ERR14]|nr:hypothetical protein [Bradyrhizobium sp. ERR14]